MRSTFEGPDCTDSFYIHRSDRQQNGQLSKVQSGKRGPASGNFELSKGTLRLKLNDGSGKRAPRFGRLQPESMRAGRRLTASRRGQDKRGRRRSAAILPNELSWGKCGRNGATCGDMWQNAATRARLKQHMTKCKGDLWPFFMFFFVHIFIHLYVIFVVGFAALLLKTPRPDRVRKPVRKCLVILIVTVVVINSSNNNVLM